MQKDARKMEIILLKSLFLLFMTIVTVQKTFGFDTIIDV